MDPLRKNASAQNIWPMWRTMLKSWQWTTYIEIQWALDSYSYSVSIAFTALSGNIFYHNATAFKHQTLPE